MSDTFERLEAVRRAMVERTELILNTIADRQTPTVEPGDHVVARTTTPLLRKVLGTARHTQGRVGICAPDIPVPTRS
jgi:hypothetical protein